MRLLRLLFIALMLSAFHASAQSDLIGRWNFEEGSGTTTADLSGNSHDGTIMGTAEFSTDAAVGDGSVYLNRGNGNYVDVGSLDLGENFSISMWAKVLSGSTNIQCLFSNYVGGISDGGFAMYINEYGTTDKSIRIYAGNGTAYEKGASNLDVITYDEWNHVAVTVNRTAGTLAIYVNGVDVTDDGAIQTDFINTGGCTLGTYTTGSWAINGGIDDVRVYSKELSASEIGNIYAGTIPTDLIGHWAFEEGSGTTTADLSGNGNDGTINGNTSFTADAAIGDYAVAMTRAGGDNVSIGTIELGDQFTFCAWANIISNSNSIQCLFSNYPGGYPNAGLAIYLNEYSTMDQSVRVYAADGTNGNNAGTAEYTYEFDTWNHVVVTVDKTAGTAVIYVNGEDVTADGEISTTFPTSGDCTLGSYNTGYYAVNGSMDDVRIYSKILSASQVVNVMNGLDPGNSLTVDIVGEGEVVPGSGAFAADSVIAITAIPKYGWAFAGWSGDASGSDLVGSLTMDSDKSITATFVPATTEVRDTVAKLNFTYEPVLNDVEGWTGIYDLTSFPLTLDNGVVIEMDSNDHTVGSGTKGEPITPFPHDVGNTYNYLHATPDAYSLRFIVTGLDTTGIYSFDAFSSRDGASSSGNRPAFYTIEGTGDTIEVNCVGNKSTIATFNEITPDSSGTIVFTLSKAPGAYAYINAMVITKEIPAVLDVAIEGEGVVVPDTGSYALGEEVILTAIPKYGWKLAGWSGAASGSDLTTTVVMDSLTTVAATFVPITTEVRDTIAKLNFTYEPVLNDVEGWTGIYDLTSFPLSLDGGVVIDTDAGDYTVASGTKGEPITPFPNNVGNTYNYLHAAFDYSVRFIVTGLDTTGVYSFDAFSSRDGASSSGERPAYYTVEGTGDTIEVNCVGNKSTIATFDGITPDSTGTIVFTISKNPGAYSYINAMVITKVIPAVLDVTIEGEGVVVPDAGSYVLGEEVAISAIPKYGSRFLGWSGAASGSDLVTTVIMDSLTNVTATFVELPVTLEAVAKLNFTYEPVLNDVDGWTGIYDHTTTPIDLPNGIHIELETQGHSTGSGTSAEPITPFPDNVGNTFNYMHALAVPYSIRLIISGLDTSEKYSFEAFSSRNGATSSGYRPAIYTVEGTGDTVTVNCVGNKSTIATISGVTPDATGTLVFSVSNAPNSYAYINALVVSKELEQQVVVMDTVAKINFTDGDTYDHPDWTNVYDQNSFPLVLNNGIGIELDSEEHSIGSGASGEPLTIFPDNVGNTFCYMHSAFPYTLHFAFTGLDPMKYYNFEAFSSRNHINPYTGEPYEEERVVTFGIEGTDLEESLDGIGNTDKTVVFERIYPSIDSTIILTASNIVDGAPNYAYINALVVTKEGDPLDTYELTTLAVGGGTISPASGEFVVGTEVSIVPTADAGWEFDRWAGDVSGSNMELSVTLNTDMVVAAIFKKSDVEPHDTIAKMNFTYTEDYEADGWISIFGVDEFPLSLDGGITVNIDTEEHTISSGTTGEPINMFPANVGNTYNNLHAAFAYTVSYSFEGLDPNIAYSFEAFSSRDDYNQYTGGVFEEERISTFAIAGTDKSVDLDAIGNVDNTARLDTIYPSADGTIVFTVANNENYAYINSLVVTKTISTGLSPKDVQKISYYPSPVSDYLNVKGLPSGSRISAFDMMGRKVIDVDAGYATERKIDMQKLHVGVYLFQVRNDNTVIKNFKIIKK